MQKRTKMVTMIACFLVCMISIMTAIGTTLAFHSGGGELQNKLGTKKSSVYLEEEFKPDDKWLPGETKEKKVHFGNDGENDQVIRFKVVREWLDDNGDTWTPDASNPAEITWEASLATDWDASFLSNDGWYYYKQVLPAGETTSAVMNSVKFSSELANEENDVYKDDFSGMTYRIKVYMEGVDVDSDITKTTWGKIFSQSGNTLTWSAS